MLPLNHDLLFLGDATASKCTDKLLFFESDTVTLQSLRGVTTFEVLRVNMVNCQAKSFLSVWSR